MYTVNASAVAGSKYAISGQVLTFTDTEAGDKVRVYYKSDTDATAKSVKVTSDKFGGTFRLVLDCLIRDEYTKTDYAGQLVVFNAKIEDNFKFEMSATGDPSVLDIPIEVLKDPSSTNMWELVIYDESLIPAS